MKHTLIISLILTFVFYNKANAQFGYAYGNQGYNYGESVCYTPHDSGLFLFGSSGWLSNGNTDFLLYKVDSLGKIKWAQNYGGTQVDKAASIIPLSDTLYALLGYTNNNSASDYQIKQVLINHTGQIIFENQFGSTGWDLLQKAIKGTDSSLVLVGQTYKNKDHNGDGFILKTNYHSDTLQSVIWGDTTEENFSNVYANATQIMVSGYKKNTVSGFKQPLIVRFNSALQPTDTFKLNTQNDGEFLVAKPLINKNILALGYVKNTSNSYLHALICLFDSSLNLIYIDSANYQGDAYWKDFVQVNNTNIMMTGGTKLVGFGGYGFYDVYFQLRTQNLDFIIGPTFGGTYEDIPSQLIALNDTIFACLGSTKNFGPALSHYFLLKFNSNHPVISPEKFLTGFIYQPNNTPINISIFPNPFTDYIRISGFKGTANIKIYGINGGIMINRQITRDTFLFLSYLSSGLYIVEIETTQGTIRRKIIKQ